MTELHELPTPAAGRVGMCRKSIEAALKMGFSLDDCARRLGLNYKTFWQAYRANKIIVEPEKQVPLPALPLCRVAHSTETKETQVETQVSKSGILESTPKSNVIDLDDPANQ
jgi:hypothetical protein